MKGIIVIDNPKACIECPMFYHSEDMSIGGMKFEKLYRCKIEPEGIEDPYLSDILKKKPDWCPIKPFPEKKEVPDHILEGNGEYEKGWNDCIHELLKGEKE